MISGAPKIGTLRVGPSAQTILVAALEQLDGTLGRDEFIRRASNSEDEHDALFFQQCAQLMAKLNANAPLARITQLRRAECRRLGFISWPTGHKKVSLSGW